MTIERILRTCPSGCSVPSKPVIRFSIPDNQISDELIRSAWHLLEAPRPFFTYNRCSSCGLLFCPTYISEGSIAELMESSPPNMVGELDESINAQTQEAYWNFFEARFPEVGEPGRFIEIGSDIGTFASAASRTGRFDSFQLVEPNTSVHQRLRSGLNAKQIEIVRLISELTVGGDASFAAAIHVLDHLIDPISVLNNIRDRLREGGKILVVVHNEKSLLAKALGTRWYPFCLQHPQLFNPQSLKFVLEAAGYTPLLIKRSYNLFPLSFLLKKGMEAFGAPKWLQNAAMKVSSHRVVRLRLGNMIAIAKKR